ncbi:anaerobic benzoate catabolism transcriptional regulator [Nocardia farcinica]|uniref:Anaerobic benzoate catabolism transcriptional regulator n=1 Tax=Nocardia farcinica TaxID=37329 RepID=A0A449H292_NOCFR|nr:helix-turn-helix transcriptional regulator [Nocardia farcinica]VFA92145.1 anaerobic benzoate catabolism transcriptional regulator [Nocardia farcinica]
MSDEQDSYIGRRVRQIRARRGLTQQVLADRSGISRSVLAKYEAGLRPVDSRRTLLALAEALGVTLNDLTGHEDDRFDPAVAGVHASVPEIETAFWAQGDITSTAPPRSLDLLAVAALEVEQLSVRCDYASLAPKLAPLITETYQTIDRVSGAERDRAHDVLASAAITTSSVLSRFGHTSLAWTATQAAETAARATGSTAALAAAAFTRSQMLMTRAGGLHAAHRHAEATADELCAAARTVGDVEHSGMLRLQAGLATAVLGGDPDPHFTKAAEHARKLAGAEPGTPLLRNPTFGHANVQLWRLSAAMERRDAEQVLALASTLAPADLPSVGRRAQYFIEVGRAHALRRDHRQSLHALLRAEHAAPQKVRNMGHVREIVGHMMRRARRDLTTGELGSLARRVGVVPN